MEYADDFVLAVGRMSNSESPTSYVTLINFGGEEQNVDISGADFDPDMSQGIVVIDTNGAAGWVNYDLNSDVMMIVMNMFLLFFSTIVELNNINLSAYQTIVLQLI